MPQQSLPTIPSAICLLESQETLQLATRGYAFLTHWGVDKENIFVRLFKNYLQGKQFWGKMWPFS